MQTKISFEKLKENCVREFCGKNTRMNQGASVGTSPSMLAIAQLVELKNTGKFVNPRKLIVEIEDDCVKAIELVDIRNVKALIQLCPESVPTWIKSGNYKVDLSDDGRMIYRS